MCIKNVKYLLPENTIVFHLSRKEKKLYNNGFQ